MLNLATLLEHSAREFPDREAVVAGAVRLTYAQVDRTANQVAGALVALGVAPGDTVALSCPNVPEFPILYYGILKTGAGVMPLNMLLTEREVAYHLHDSAAKAYVCFEGTTELPTGEVGRAAFDATPGCEHFVVITEDPHDRRPGTLAALIDGRPGTFDTSPTQECHTAVVLYTSGTTGTPKGAELTHSSLVLNALIPDRLFGHHPHDVHLVALPLFHTYGQTVQLNAGFAAGATLVLQRRFDAEQALDLMEREGVTFFAGVPTMFWELLAYRSAERFDLATIARTLRMCLSAGAALPVSIAEKFERRFGVPLLEGYGMTELSPIALWHPMDQPYRPGSIGLPVWGVEVKVVAEDGAEAGVDEPGELHVRGHNVMKGYLNRPGATAEALSADGWFRTGDIGRRDKDGYYHLIDRKKDMIIRGGYNVYPRELEEILLTHPEVSLAAVVGVPHERNGQEVQAFVIRKPGSTISEDELIAWCRQNMAAYKYPRIITFRDTLPMTASGKILKRELAPAPN
ncbi:long-chain-fatty-acid--CoA ligase [Streptosporangium sp. CA-115845]|uniref:long-chain-fatty-acid--CoA ligase n=1 Tax=Streptosporangium sp. CA-115845 TaxID=3240071 RepID=UPI003D8ADD6B